MTLKSMTGFARQEGTYANASWFWELKSVNGKGLDIRARIPSFLSELDIEAKKIIQSKLARGSVFVNLSIEIDQTEEQLNVHEGRLLQLIDLAVKYQDVKGVIPPSLDGLLGLKGVMDIASSEMTEDEKLNLITALKESLKEGLAKLIAAREDEGQRMQRVLMNQLSAIKALVQDAVVASGDRLAAMKTRFRTQVEKLYEGQGELNEDRLAQEIAIIAVKADIQEELDRLHSHIEEGISLLSKDKSVGRRLDFLTQEFNREANTLCSKSSDVALTRIGMDMKTIIDQFREQIQNIE